MFYAAFPTGVQTEMQGTGTYLSRYGSCQLPTVGAVGKQYILHVVLVFALILFKLHELIIFMRIN